MENLWNHAVRLIHWSMDFGVHVQSFYFSIEMKDCLACLCFFIEFSSCLCQALKSELPLHLCKGSPHSTFSNLKFPVIPTNMTALLYMKYLCFLDFIISTKWQNGQWLNDINTMYYTPYTHTHTHILIIKGWLTADFKFLSIHVIEVITVRGMAHPSKLSWLSERKPQWLPFFNDSFIVIHTIQCTNFSVQLAEFNICI